jgi:urease accessory protein
MATVTTMTTITGTKTVKSASSACRTPLSGFEDIATADPAAPSGAERRPGQIPPLLRLQSWLSPAFPIGAYSYSHALEWAVEEGTVRDRASLVDWLEADLRFGSGRNEALFFCAAWRAARADDLAAVIAVAELAAAFRGTSELALEAFQQGAACLAALRKAWPHCVLDAIAAILAERCLAPAPSVCLGTACALHAAPLDTALPLFLQSAASNLVTAAVRLIPLGQSEGQLAIAALESAACAADLGSAAFMVDLASMSHETQYTRLFRS